MTDPAPPKPPARKAPDSREARLKAALKANLGRRKAQGRDRAAQDGEQETGQDEG